MADALTTLKTRLANLRQERAEIALIQKEAFMAAPPMPGGGGMPPQGMPPGMDPSMMGGMPPQGMPPGMDPSMMGGMPPGMDPSMMGGMPPGMDPSMMGGMPPQGMPVDPNTGMPLDPNAAGQQPPTSPISPEMLEELIGIVEQLAAGQEKHEQQVQQISQQHEELMNQFEELQQQLAQMFAGPQPGAGGM